MKTTNNYRRDFLKKMGLGAAALTLPFAGKASSSQLGVLQDHSKFEPILNDFDFEFKFSGDYFLGIGDVKADGISLRSNKFSMFAQVTTPEAIELVNFKLSNKTVNKEGITPDFSIQKQQIGGLAPLSLIAYKISRKIILRKFGLQHRRLYTTGLVGTIGMVEGVISFRDREPGNIIKNVQIKNVLIEDPFPAYPPFFFKMTNPNNSNKLCLFQNIIIEDVLQNSPSVKGSMDNSFGKPRNTIVGLDDIRKLTNITFKNCIYKVKWITSYEEGDFLKNDYLSNIVFVVNFDVSLSVNDLNGGTASSGGVFNYGESLTVMATPTDGYKFKGWTVNNEMVLENLQYTFNATQNAAIKANFEIFVNNGQAPDTSFKIYPNPASDKLFVNSAGKAVSKIQLIDLTGKVVYSKNEVSQNEMIDLSGFNDGLSSNPFIQ